MVEPLTIHPDFYPGILSFLPDHEDASLVSKEFFSVTNELRKTLNIFDKNVVSALLTRFPNLSCLSFHGLPSSELEPILLRIAESPLKLRTLDVSNHVAVPRKCFTRLAERCGSSLTALKCSNMEKLNGWDILIICDCFPLLEELDISFPRDALQRVSDNAIEDDSPVCEAVAKALSSELPHLRRLNLSGNLSLKDAQLLFLCSNSCSLEELSIAQCSYLTASAISAAICIKEKLRSICLGGTFGKDLGESLINLKFLTSIEILHAKISDDFLCSIGKSRPPLVKLILDGCIGYSFLGLRQICNYIMHLGLEYADFLVDENMLEISLLLGKKLKIIQMNYCKRLTGVTFSALAKHCEILCDISMVGTSFQRVRGLDFINRNISVNLSCNRLLSDAYTLVNVCSNVEWLDLSRTNIKDDSLFSISRCFTVLLSLNLDGCSNITFSGIKKVIKNCKKLREISLKGCCRVEANTIASMVSWRPSLRRISAPRSCDVPLELRELILQQHGCLIS